MDASRELLVAALERATRRRNAVLSEYNTAWHRYRQLDEELGPLNKAVREARVALLDSFDDPVQS